jgi:hypothetical protein
MCDDVSLCVMMCFAICDDVLLCATMCNHA